MKKHEIRLWAVLFWLLVWEGMSRILDQELFLVSPVKALLRLRELSFTPSFWDAVFCSTLRIMGGYCGAVFLGVLFAAFASRYLRFRELCMPLMLAIRSVPVASFIILALVIFSSRRLSTLISFLMTLPVIYGNVLEGIRGRSKEMDEMAFVFRIPLIRRVRFILLPQVEPFLYSACEVAAGLAWKAGIAAEVIGMPARSIGSSLQQAKVYLDTKDLLAWTAAVVVLSLFSGKLFLLLLKAVLSIAKMEKSISLKRIRKFTK